MNLLTGVIRPQSYKHPLDRGDIAFALWERNPKPNEVTLPWPAAASFDASQVKSLIASAKTVVVAGARSTVFEHVLGALLPQMRVYAYGPLSMEADRGLLQAFAKANDRVVVRLGNDLPADWIVVDGGRAGVIFVGPPGEARRWAIPLEPDVARSLFEAFRVLFWFHSRREGLPDASRVFAFRPPLASPYADPGTDVSLPAGRLVIDGPLPDLVPDAEFRIVPDGSKPGRTATALCLPDGGMFEVASQLARGGTKVIWTPTGLPHCTISRQRLVMDFVAAPVGLQLVWGSSTAVDTFHRITKACDAPEWTFHVQRRLRDIKGPVVLVGAATEAIVKVEERIDLGDLRAPLVGFEAARPPKFPDPSPLARDVVYSWRTVPEVVPQGAGKAQLVKQWIALDEWASGGVRTLRQWLEGMEGEERSFLDRLRGFLRGQDAVHRERLRIREALAEIGEQPPSQRSVDDADEVVRRLVDEAGRIRGLLQQAHAGRQTAEDEAEEVAQRSSWADRVETATRTLAQRRAELADLERDEADADAALGAADAAVRAATDELRQTRLLALTQARDLNVAALAEERTKLAQLDAAQKGPAPKALRLPVSQEIQRLDGAVAASKRDIAATAGWVPSQAELAAENAALKTCKASKDAIRKARNQVQAAIPPLERTSTETYLFRAGTRLQAAALPQLAIAPQVPREAPPELGELFEHQGRCFLAIKTWEQVPRATPVAARLRAQLVAFPDSTK